MCTERTVAVGRYECVAWISRIERIERIEIRTRSSDEQLGIGTTTQELDGDLAELSQCYVSMRCENESRSGAPTSRRTRRRHVLEILQILLGLVLKHEKRHCNEGERLANDEIEIDRDTGVSSSRLWLWLL